MTWTGAGLGVRMGGSPRVEAPSCARLIARSSSFNSALFDHPAGARTVKPLPLQAARAMDRRHGYLLQRKSLLRITK